MSTDDASHALTATSLDDVLAGAMWVNNLTDALLSAEQLHETFMQVIFSFVRDDDDDDGDNNDDAVGDSRRRRRRRRLRTAAERERERRVKAQLRREVRELAAQARRQQAGGVDDAHTRRTRNDDDEQQQQQQHSGNDDDDDDDEDDEESDEDDDDDDDDDMLGFHVQDQEFLDWIDTTQHAHVPATLSTSTATTTTTTTTRATDAATHDTAGVRDGDDGDGGDDDAAIELELDQLGLGAAAAAAAVDALPERYREVEVREGRPRLRAKTLPGGYTYDIPLAHEAYWVLRQLRNAGQPLAHNTRICALANRAQPEIADEPVVVALTFALQKLTRELLEPAVLMLYHQTELHPLLCALIESSSLAAAATQTVAVPSYAYSTVTGRRQQPYVSDAYVGFDALCVRNLGSTDGGDGGAAVDNDDNDDVVVAGGTSNGGGGGGGGERCWRRERAAGRADYAQRKPCFVELGRLLVRILELDALCHRLEYRRQQLLIMLRDSVEARVQDQRTLLERIVFESSAEADVWHTFTQILTGGRSSTGARHRVRELGLDGAYEEYTITGLQYQDNLLANAPLTLCPVQQLPLQTWAAQVGRGLPSPRSADAVLALFNAAIVDEFSALPVLCRHVTDLFCAEGDVVVGYRWLPRRDEVYALASFFAERPEQYMTLLQMERQGTVVLHYVLDTDLVRRVLNIYQLYQRRTRASTNNNSSSGSSSDLTAGAFLGDDAELDDWTRERAAAMELLVLRLTERVTAKVKAELYQHALYHLHLTCVQRLALVCMQGPYEPTYLCLDDYEALANTATTTMTAVTTTTTMQRARHKSALAGDALALMTWEPSWNVVEALPCIDDDDEDNEDDDDKNEASSSSDGDKATMTTAGVHTGRVPPRRVCAAYRASNGVTYFAFIDAYGAVLATTRWVDCAPSSAAGRAAALLQSSALEKLFVQHTPAVIAVGASEMRAMPLMRTLRRFVRERVHAALRVHVPVVWASCEVARYCSVTRYADEEAATSTATPGAAAAAAAASRGDGGSSADYHVRTAIMLARYVQDPLLTTCLLFDARRTVLQLCLNSGTGIVSSSGGGGVTRSREHEDQLYRRLCWEMTLWVSASGVWLEDIVRRPHATAVLQFVAGLGPSKARVLHESVCTRPLGSRAAMTARLRGLFGDIVCRNASSLLRIAATTLSTTTTAEDDDNDDSNDDDDEGAAAAAATHDETTTKATRAWHVLDQTLIPSAWYDTAAAVAARVLRNEPRHHTKTTTAAAAVTTTADATTRKDIHARFSDDEDDDDEQQAHDARTHRSDDDSNSDNNSDDDDATAMCAVPLVALYNLLDCRTAVRRALLVGGGTQQQQDLYAWVQAQQRDVQRSNENNNDSDGVPGERELELVLEEMIACGASHLRRPYRRMSSRELMTCLTGVTYVTGDEAARFLRPQQLLPSHLGGGGGAALSSLLSSTAALTRGGAAVAAASGAADGAVASAVVCEGDVVSGTITAVRAGAMPGIFLVTSRGVAAFIAAADVDDETMRGELLAHIRHLERTRNERDHNADNNADNVNNVSNSVAPYQSPEWLRRGAPIQGQVLRCNWRHCELQLRWCRPREIDVLAIDGNDGDGDAATAGGNNNYLSLLSFGARDGAAAAASSVNSLKTVQMERDARVFATKISRHPLFRDVTSARAAELLHDKELGELLLRPARGARNRAVCVVKVGARCTSNWVIREERRADGRLYYRMKDAVVGQVHDFDDVDEFLRNYIAPMVQLVVNVRQHRRFQETMRDVATALVDQERSGYGFTYAFVEAGQGSRPPHYRVVTRGGGREYRFRLHITDRFIYVRLPFRVEARARERRGVGDDHGNDDDDDDDGDAHRRREVAELKWVQCRSAEHVSETIKKHAVLNS